VQQQDSIQQVIIVLLNNNNKNTSCPMMNKIIWVDLYLSHWKMKLPNQESLKVDTEPANTDSFESGDKRLVFDKAKNPRAKCQMKA
jgi:hypothetical protein